MKSTTKYETVPLSDLRQGRRGKHHKAVTAIFEQLQNLSDGQAIKVPVGGPEGSSVANLRSAIIRAGESRGINVGTYSADGYLYVWRRTAATRRYERVRREA